MLFSSYNVDAVYRKKWGTENYDLANKEFRLNFGRDVNITHIWGQASLAPKSCGMSLSSANTRVRQSLITLWSIQANTWDPLPFVDQTFGTSTNSNNQVDNAIVALILKQPGKSSSAHVVFERHDVGVMNDLRLMYDMGWGSSTSNNCNAPNAEVQMVITYNNV